MMNVSCEKFVEELAATSEGLNATKAEVLREWEPDDPPITILFSALGSKIADDFGNSEVELNQEPFGMIENAMSSEDNDLVTAVATGLIEALVTQAHENGIWEEIASLLGEVSRSHADAWLTAD